MPLGSINQDGAALYYEDTGAPGGTEPYITIILVHGTMFHSAVFRPMIPYAVSPNLRLVMLNLRDYHRSTLYTPAELQALSSSDRKRQAAAIAARGLELAEFCRWFIETEHIPPIAKSSEFDGALSGGLSVLGWSSGNCQTFPLVAHADKVPPETNALLNTYLRNLIVYDMSEIALGMSPPDDLDCGPFRDDSLSPAERVAAFPAWVSAYFTQAIIGPDEDADSPCFASMLIPRVAMHLHDPDRQWVPTVLRMSSETLAQISDDDVMERSQMFIQHADPSIYTENVRRVLFGISDSNGETTFPLSGVKIRVLWCDMSLGHCIFAAFKMKHLLSEHHKTGQPVRDVQFYRVEKVNHFAHWDDPERFTRLLAEVV
ncbi:hypothetical protein WOLCODRAFT_116116 [Wolfiporia cocos MD-104 SS10]|uniref:AB hydrolase-1 domain-containing protein n=1 Tax=Wolfiporia cocos (strain MD-104) TaxID=742152 RepID=A0A2H3JIP2_WOLCO|nr:hypothetical protein WOLCODRAFT_116116 [Wolfiporia cocos MD-104 SS10]